MEPTDTVSKAREARAGVFDLLPTGLWFGGALALARAWLVAAPPSDFTTDEALLLRWGTLQAFPSLLAEAAVAGVAGGLLLVVAANGRRPWLRVLAFVFALVAATAFLAGLPAPEGIEAVPGLRSDVAVLAIGCASIALLLAHTGNLVRGRLALVTAGLIAIGLPVLVARVLASDAPQMSRRLVIADIVASSDAWSVLEQRPGLAPKPMTMTPLVDQHADVADKPAIRMAPPCAVGFDVPLDAGACVLRAAAGADLSVTGRLPAGLEALAIDYSVEVDGAVVWSERVAHAPMPTGVWAPELFVWRHAGGTEGIALRPGQRVVLRTAFAPEQDLSKLDSERGLDLGFGGVVLERRVPRARTTARPDAPNIVLIVMDTQRADRLGCYGYSRTVSPHIDGLARRGTLFEESYATASWTWPSTASLMTGMLPDEHGVTDSAHCTLAHAHRTLAEALQARGYSTAAFSGNPLIVAQRQFDQGFERFDGRAPDFRMSDELVPSALDWLQRNASARFFLYLHLVDPHTPHRPHPEEAARLQLGEPPEGWPAQGADGIPVHPASVKYDVTPAVRRYMNEEYDASVATGDRWVGAVLSELARLGLDDRTIVCFTSDHGEGLLDHGLRGHGNSVYAEEVRVPLILAGPGIAAERRVRGAVSNRHVAPTLAAFGGTDLAARDPLHLLDRAPPESALFSTLRGRVGAERSQLLHGLRSGTWTLHWRERPLEGRMLAPVDVLASDLWLFDAAADPREAADLASFDEERARSLLQRLQEQLADARAHAPSIALGVGAGGMATLRHIGYAGGDDE